MIPFRMKRVPKKLKIPGTAKMKTHWVVTLEIAASTEEIRRVIAGEILYLGQQRNKEYELETTGPAEGREDEAVIEPETEEETREREAEEIRKQEALKKEYEETNKRQAKLKEKIETGETSIRTPEETKKIKEEREILITKIEKLAKEYKIDTWGKIIKIGEIHNIFPKGLVASQAKTFIYDHPDKYSELWDVIKGDQEIKDEDIPF
ncbi:hypothetical protein ES703_29248 [subsurface metagenome]